MAANLEFSELPTNLIVSVTVRSEAPMRSTNVWSSSNSCDLSVPILLEAPPARMNASICEIGVCNLLTILILTAFSGEVYSPNQ